MYMVSLGLWKGDGDGSPLVMKMTAWAVGGGTGTEGPWPEGTGARIATESGLPAWDAISVHLFDSIAIPPSWIRKRKQEETKMRGECEVTILEGGRHRSWHLIREGGSTVHVSKGWEFVLMISVTYLQFLARGSKHLALYCPIQRASVLVQYFLSWAICKMDDFLCQI